MHNFMTYLPNAIAVYFFQFFGGFFVFLWKFIFGFFFAGLVSFLCIRCPNWPLQMLWQASREIGRLIGDEIFETKAYLVS